MILRNRFTRLIPLLSLACELPIPDSSTYPFGRVAQRAEPLFAALLAPDQYSVLDPHAAIHAGDRAQDLQHGCRAAYLREATPPEQRHRTDDRPAPIQLANDAEEPQALWYTPTHGTQKPIRFLEGPRVDSKIERDNTSTCDVEGPPIPVQYQVGWVRLADIHAVELHIRGVAHMHTGDDVPYPGQMSVLTGDAILPLATFQA